MHSHRQPAPTVDAIIELPGDRVVLIERKYAPLGCAFPGGFMDEGETAEEACRREAREETGLEVELIALLGVYSDPARDPRRHTISAVYVARASDEPRAGDDAALVRVVGLAELARLPLAFDHGRMAADYLRWRETGLTPAPRTGPRR